MIDRYRLRHRVRVGIHGHGYLLRHVPVIHTEFQCVRVGISGLRIVRRDRHVNQKRRLCRQHNGVRHFHIDVRLIDRNRGPRKLQLVGFAIFDCHVEGWRDHVAIVRPIVGNHMRDRDIVVVAIRV